MEELELDIEKMGGKAGAEAEKVGLEVERSGQGRWRGRRMVEVGGEARKRWGGVESG